MYSDSIANSKEQPVELNNKAINFLYILTDTYYIKTWKNIRSIS